jgi:hypothetical protein
MNEDNSSSSGIIKKFRNDDRTSIHEHDFMSIRAKKEEEEQKSIICLTCGTLYCEKCGKLVRQ